MTNHAATPPARPLDAGIPPETTDPLIGTQETTDSTEEMARTPDEEVTLSRAATETSDKSRRVAGWLGIFLGGLGVHRFYLGYHMMGAAIAGLTLLPAILVGIVGLLMPQMTSWGVGFIALGVASLGLVWGFSEGVAIFLGMLDRDACGRKLAP